MLLLIVTRNWDDGANDMFSFAPGSPEEITFKNSKRGTHIKNIPKFSTAPASDLATSVSFSPLVLTPMSLAFNALLNQVPVGVFQSVDKELLQFMSRYREDSNLLGQDLRSEVFCKHLSTELQFLFHRRNTIFKKNKLMEVCTSNFAKYHDWDLYLHVEFKILYARKYRDAHCIADHLTATPAANSSVSLKGMSKHSWKKSGHIKNRFSSCFEHHHYVVTRKDYCSRNEQSESFNKLEIDFFSQLFCVPEVHRKLDHCKIAPPTNLRGTKSSSLNLFGYFPSGTYFLRTRVQI